MDIDGVLMEPVARRRARRGRDDSGFTLIELLVALVIIALVMMSLAGVFVGSKKTIAESKQRQAATGLATRVIEQLRALPYDTVVAGLNNDATALAADSDIVQVSGVYRLRPSWDSTIDEVLQVGSSSNQAPLNPHVVDTSVGSVSYRVKTYVTQATGSGPVRYWLTAAVSWSSNATQGNVKRVVSRSQVYSPTGCLSTATHPFSGPCQASFFGQAGNGLGSISVRSSTDGAPIVPGLDATSAALDLRGFAASAAIEQVVTVSGRATNTAARLLSSSGEQLAGGATAVTSASSDPSNSTGLTPNATTPAGSTTPLVADSAVARLTASTATDSGSSASTTAAASTSGCNDTAGNVIVTSQPCGSAESSSGGAVSLALALKGATRELPLDLASTGSAASPSRAFTARFVTGGQTWCPTATAGGCSAAGASRHLAPLVLGGLPAASEAGDVLPSGYAGMLRLQPGYSASVSSSSGTGSSTPTAAVSGGVEYWNGFGYTSVPLSGLAASSSYTPPQARASYVDGGSTWTISVDADVTIGGYSTTPSTGACQDDPCTSSARVASPIAGFLTYVVNRDDVEVTRFQIQVDLGDLLVKTSYQAAPSA